MTQYLVRYLCWFSSLRGYHFILLLSCACLNHCIYILPLNLFDGTIFVHVHHNVMMCIQSQLAKINIKGISKDLGRIYPEDLAGGFS